MFLTLCRKKSHFLNTHFFLFFANLKTSCYWTADKTYFILFLCRCTRGLRHWISQTTTFQQCTELIFTRVMCPLLWTTVMKSSFFLLLPVMSSCVLFNILFPLFYFATAPPVLPAPTSQEGFFFCCFFSSSLEHCTVCIGGIRAQMKTYYCFVQFAVRVVWLTKMWSLVSKRCLKNLKIYFVCIRLFNSV